MKVSANTLVGSVTPELIAYAIRLVITLVFPVPAPAITQTGPRIAVTTANCSASNSVNICLLSTAMTHYPLNQYLPHLRTKPLSFAWPHLSLVAKLANYLK